MFGYIIENYVISFRVFKICQLPCRSSDEQWICRLNPFINQRTMQFKNIQINFLLGYNHIFDFMSKSKYAINVEFENTISTFFLTPTSTVGQLKDLIFQDLGVNPESQLLVLNQDFLTDNDKKISALGIKGMQVKFTLNSMMEERGFGFNALDQKDIRQFSSKAPEWRRVSPGLHLQAKCKNPNCPANGKIVCVNKGFGEFQIGAQIHKCQCPKCKQKTEKATNLSYYGTNISITGTLDEDGKQFKLEEKIGMNQYRVFIQSEKLTVWSYLKVVARPL